MCGAPPQYKHVFLSRPSPRSGMGEAGRDRPELKGPGHTHRVRKKIRERRIKAEMKRTRQSKTRANEEEMLQIAESVATMGTGR